MLAKAFSVDQLLSVAETPCVARLWLESLSGVGELNDDAALHDEVDWRVWSLTDWTARGLFLSL